MTPQKPPQSPPKPPGARPRERGVVIIWYALFLLLMLSFIAIGVDLAKLMAGRSQLQNAADAAALAGASAIDPATGVITVATAVARAQQTGALNKAFINDPQPVVVDPGDVVVATNTCRVTVRREGDNSIVTHFAQVLGIPNLEMTATATAQADTAGAIQDCGVVPLGVQEPPTLFQTGCSPTYQLKLGAGSGTSGNFGYVQLPTGCPGSPCTQTGANSTAYLMCALTNGFCCPLTIGQSLDTAPGNRSGPFKQAISARFAMDTDSRRDICYSQYTGNGQRVVLIPIVEGDPNGTSPVTIKRFAAFFLQNDVPGTGTDSILNGEFIDYVVTGTGGGVGPGPVSYILRLIR